MQPQNDRYALPPVAAARLALFSFKVRSGCDRSRIMASSETAINRLRNPVHLQHLHPLRLPRVFGIDGSYSVHLKGPDPSG